MKKIFSISLLLLMLGAMLHLSVATHYCGGTIASSKISLSGKTASCGMENGENISPVTGDVYSRLCCENKIINCGITSCFFPTFSIVPEKIQEVFQPLFYADALIPPLTSHLDLYSGMSPPGHALFKNVNLAQICILRI